MAGISIDIYNGSEATEIVRLPLSIRNVIAADAIVPKNSLQLDGQDFYLAI